MLSLKNNIERQIFRIVVNCLSTILITKEGSSKNKKASEKYSDAFFGADNNILFIGNS